MGKGDKKTKKGKIWRGTFGKRRLKKSNQSPVTPPSKKTKSGKSKTKSKTS